MKNQFVSKSILFIFFLAVTKFSFSQECDSWLKSVSDIVPSATSLVMDDESNLYIGNRQTSPLLVKLNSDGDVLWEVNSPTGNYCDELFIDNNIIYAVEITSGVIDVLKFDLDGTFLGDFRINSVNKCDIAIKSNFIAVSEPGNITKYDTDGNLLFSKDYETGNNQGEGIYDIKQIAIIGENIYFTRTFERLYIDFEITIRVHELDPNGNEDYVGYIYSFTPMSMVAGPDKLYIVIRYVEFGINVDIEDLACIDINGSSGFTTRPWEYVSQSRAFVDSHRDKVYTTIRSGGGQSTFNDHGLVTYNINGNETIRNIHYISYIKGIVSDENNIYMLGSGSSNFYIDHHHLSNGNKFLAKFTDDFQLLSPENSFTGPDLNVYCGEEFTIGKEGINPYVDSNPNDLFGSTFFTWDNNSNQSYITEELEESNSYALNIRSGSCSINQTVNVEVEKKTAFTYSIDSMTITLDITNDDLINFQWDFGDGNSNDFNSNPTYTYSTAGSFSICLRDLDGSNSCSTCEVLTFPQSTDTTNSISEISKYNFKVNPNPVRNGKIKISFENQINGFIQVSISDITGKEIMNQELSSNNFKDFNLSIPKNLEGVYILSVVNNNSRISRKILIE